jgi:hypothetical protein
MATFLPLPPAPTAKPDLSDANLARITTLWRNPPNNMTAVPNFPAPISICWPPKG